MKVIVAGSRDHDDFETVMRAMEESGFQASEVVSGGARGVDALGERWAKEHGVTLTRFPADWEKHKKAAGPIRNAAMADYVAPDGGLVAVWDGESRGTQHMIETAKRKGLKVFVARVAPSRIR